MFLFKSLDVLASWPADLHLVFSKGCRSWVGLAGQTLSNQTFAQTYPGKPTLLPKYKISIEWSRTIRYPQKTCWHFRGQDSIGTVAILYVADTQKDKSSYKSFPLQPFRARGHSFGADNTAVTQMAWTNADKCGQFADIQFSSFAISIFAWRLSIAAIAAWTQLSLKQQPWPLQSRPRHGNKLEQHNSHRLFLAITSLNPFIQKNYSKNTLNPKPFKIRQKANFLTSS